LTEATVEALVDTQAVAPLNDMVLQLLEVGPMVIQQVGPMDSRQTVVPMAVLMAIQTVAPQVHRELEGILQAGQTGIPRVVPMGILQVDPMGIPQADLTADLMGTPQGVPTVTLQEVQMVDLTATLQEVRMGTQHLPHLLLSMAHLKMEAC